MTRLISVNFHRMQPEEMISMPCVPGQSSTKAQMFNQGSNVEDLEGGTYVSTFISAVRNSCHGN